MLTNYTISSECGKEIVEEKCMERNKERTEHMSRGNGLCGKCCLSNEDAFSGVRIESKNKM